MPGTRSDPVADPGHALIIGAGPGIGAGVARRFASEGFRLTLVARDPDHLRTVATPLREPGTVVQTLTADAGDPYALRAGLEPVFAIDPPGVVVYNAARLAPDDLLASDQDGLQSAYAVNVVGAIVAAQLAAPTMRAGGHGTIIFTGGEPGPEYGTLALGKQSLRAVAVILSQQLAEVVHVAYVTIAGATASDRPLAPDVIGDAYWRIHAEAPAQWRTEYRLDAAGATV